MYRKIYKMTRSAASLMLMVLFMFTVLFFSLNHNAKADDLYWLDTLLKDSDTIVTGTVTEARLVKSTNFPLVSIEYKLNVKRIIHRNNSCFHENLDQTILNFYVEVDLNSVPTGSEGIFFLDTINCKVRGVSGRYSLYPLNIRGEVDKSGRPLSNKKLFRALSFLEKIQLTEDQSEILTERVQVLSLEEIGSVTYMEVIKAERFLEFAREEYGFIDFSNKGQ